MRRMLLRPDGSLHRLILQLRIMTSIWTPLRPIGAMVIVGLLSFTFWSLIALLATQIDFALPIVASSLPPADEIDYWASKIRNAGSKLWTPAHRLAGGRDACEGWNPDQPESMDDPDCLRARQYRQIEALLSDPLTLQK